MKDISEHLRFHLQHLLFKTTKPRSNILWTRRRLHTWQSKSFGINCLNWAAQFSDYSSVQTETRQVKSAQIPAWPRWGSFQVRCCRNLQHWGCDVWDSTTAWTWPTPVPGRERFLQLLGEFSQDEVTLWGLLVFFSGPHTWSEISCNDLHSRVVWMLIRPPESPPLCTDAAARSSYAWLI